MPMFPPDLSEALRSLQRQIDQINTARPGPMSWGPGDGHTRFYGPDGTTVLFEAVGGTGASVVSRGALTGMTGLLDSIRDTDDAQNGRLNDQHGWIESLGTRMGGAEGRLDGHDSTLASHNTRISTAQSSADGANSRAGALEGRATALEGTASSHDTRISTAQSRADSAWTLANGKASAAAVTAAQARADAAYTMAGNAHDNAAALRTQVRNWIEQARQDDPSLPPNIPA